LRRIGLYPAPIYTFSLAFLRDDNGGQNLLIRCLAEASRGHSDHVVPAVDCGYRRFCERPYIDRRAQSTDGAIPAGIRARVMRGLQAIERNSRFQAQMISDLLDYAGITFGKMRLVAETIDPYIAIRAALDVLTAAAQTAGVELHARFADESLTVEADASRLQQIVWNLLSNAVKFSTQGGKVLLEAGRDGNNLRIVVTDHGRGIEPAYLPRIFDRFSQQDATTTRSHGGLGLGLAIVKQLTELHGGTIRAHSAGKGMGATFVVKIPLSQNESSAELSDSQTLRSINFSGVIALVVEDDAAFACIASSNANILISDIGMAHQDGYQLIRRLRSSGYPADSLPAIALTAFARMEDRAEAALRRSNPTDSKNRPV
jgi:CheY-like chemotaxis protein/anti-sigma regulatory factor (Ser/Thr protein kinase)